ncbi:hypothetical protein J6590_055119 [Homalodisca vitripennis]|nr:hypothetical protein J6590_055119 [Homalodisca vitripennis]
MKAVYPVLFFVAVTAALDLEQQLERDEIIDAVNSGHSTWTAGRNFNPSFTKKYIKHLLGTFIRPEGSRLPALVDDGLEIDLPKNFDAREKWSKCISLQKFGTRDHVVPAVAAAAVFTDRYCIASNMAFNGHLSAAELLCCCNSCGSGCGGGWPDFAWQYFESDGIVTGGDYQKLPDFGSSLALSRASFRPVDPPETLENSQPPKTPILKDFRATGSSALGGTGICNFLICSRTLATAIDLTGCQPYTLPACEHHVLGKRKNCSAYGDLPTPPCKSKCYNKKYKDHSFADDHHKVKSTFSISHDVGKTQKEIFKNGPVEATFTVYEDFLSYKSGVYQHMTGGFSAGHAVKVIGWGVEKNVPYWLVANSWNSDWGDHGFFKIKRGSNECCFEGDMCGGYPDV